MNNIYFIILLTAVFSILIIQMVIGFIKRKNYPVAIETLTIYACYFLYLYVNSRINFRIRDFILLFVVLSILGHLYIGKYKNVFYKSQHYDRYLHMFGAMSFALFTYFIIKRFINPPPNPKLYIAIYVASLGTALGCIFELCEFLNDNISKFKSQHGLRDTDWDMIGNLIGAVIAGLISLYI